ncbi:alpha/beta hydrolase fold domain-containing protein [Roseateles saccharophilus]|uniref:Acetyl esterase/lipase n=1 Tax=Roseateles saccharophilus TaxID=304 RepID=A0A4R3V2G6_ROSSA|nr:alpha/beta hydrolase fold domain-containing protein [Roseateles saccharophilus]TCU97443.1 acetyl esterase/lipase [Roseateles saccharophilus]
MDKTVAPASLRLGPAPGQLAHVYTARRPLDGDARALLLWLHGGSFTDGSLASARARSELLAEAGADVVALDYPLAPAHPFPAGLSASFEALQALAAKPARLTGSARTALFVGGEEAGGNLAAALALMARDQHAPTLAGQLLVSPMLDPQLGSASMRKGECGGCECSYAKGWQAYLGDGIRADHPYATPVNASRLNGLAPALVLSLAGHPLNDESRRYAAALRQHGGCVRDLSLPAIAPEQVLNPIHDFLREAARRALSLPA